MLRDGRFTRGPVRWGQKGGGDGASAAAHRAGAADRPVLLFVRAVGGRRVLAITNGVGAIGSQSQSASSGAAGSGAQQTAVAGLPAQSGQYLLGSAIALGVMAVVSVAAGWVVAGRVLRPLRQMTSAARRISADSLHERLAINGPEDELKDLADTIDALLERLDGAFAAQRRFVANASHELRTPLAAMRVSVDVAEAKPEPVPARYGHSWPARSAPSSTRSTSCWRSLLTLARAEHGALHRSRGPLALDYVVSAALAVACGRDHRQAPHRRHGSGGDALGRGSAAAARRMTDNLIDNADRATTARRLDPRRTTTDNGAARLIVENSGPILDPAQVAGLAQPFRRLGPDRTGLPTPASDSACRSSPPSPPRALRHPGAARPARWRALRHGHAAARRTPSPSPSVAAGRTMA